MSVRKLQTIWKNRFQYRAFANRSVGVVTLVSSNLGPEDANVATTSEATYCIDGDHGFCDLEVRFYDEIEAPSVDLPLEMTEMDEVSVDIDLECPCSVFDGWSQLQILWRRKASRWMRLSNSPLAFGVTDSGVLAVLAIDEITDDPRSDSEAAWLTHLGLPD